MRGDSDVVGERRVVGLPKFHSGGKCMYDAINEYQLRLDVQRFLWPVYISYIIIYLFSVNTFTPIERCAIIFVIAQVRKLLIGQKYKNYRTMQGVIGH